MDFRFHPELDAADGDLLGVHQLHRYRRKWRHHQVDLAHLGDFLLIDRPKNNKKYFDQFVTLSF